MTNQIFFHVGIAVSDIESVTDFFKRLFGFQLVQTRTINHAYLGELVNNPGIKAQVNMLEMDKGHYFEILKWEFDDSQKENAGKSNLQIFDLGAQHLCLYTLNAQETYEKLKLEKEIEFISNAPIKVESGPNLGSKVFFVRAFGFLFLEIFERSSK